MTSVAARILAVADQEQRRNKRGAHAPSVAALTDLPLLQVRRAFADAQRRGYVRTRNGSGLRPMKDVWVVTEAGRRAIENGYGEVKKLAEDDLRTRAWRAMRLQRKFTVASVLNIVLQAPADNYRSAHVRLCRYLCLLEAVSVIACIERTREGKRFFLVEDLGQLAPVPHPATARIFDPNADRYVDRPSAAQLLGTGARA